MLYFRPDLHVAMIGNQLAWVGGVDIFEDEALTKQVPTRFIFDTMDFRVIDDVTNKEIKDMNEEEFAEYLERLKTAKITEPANAQFLADYEEAMTRGLYGV